MSNFTFFWDGPFSNWYSSQFTYNGIEFSCGEQYMMYCKAMLFGDVAVADAIMQTRSPKEQKALGRTVSNFDANAWSAKCVDIMVEGLYEKFTQNPDLEKIITETGDSEIVEASPYDQIWGIGLSAGDPRAQDKTKWRGQNLLGITLMKVRDKILNGR